MQGVMVVGALKELLWDTIGEHSAVATIHFMDYPELAEFDCPDTSHLDWSDAPTFTRRISRILGALIDETPQ